METSVYLSPSEQNAILLGQRIVFGFSSILNILSLICLLRETPPHQATVRNYLVLIQCFLIAADVYLNILFEPIPLFPLAAAFCKGLLCDRGIHMAYLTNVIFWLLLMVLCSTIHFCCIFRHQTLLPPKHRAKLADPTLRAFRVFLFAAFSSPSIAWAILPTNSKENYAILMDELDTNIRWITERSSSYIVMAILPLFISVLIGFLAVLVVTPLFLLSLFVHMFRLLHSQNRSKPTHRKIQYSLVVLLIQLMVPFVMIVAPFWLLLFSTINRSLSFETCLRCYLVVPLHPIAHNILILMLNLNYRRFIIDLTLCKIRSKVVTPSIESLHIDRRKSLRPPNAQKEDGDIVEEQINQ